MYLYSAASRRLAHSASPGGAAEPGDETQLILQFQTEGEALHPDVSLLEGKDRYRWYDIGIVGRIRRYTASIQSSVNQITWANNIRPVQDGVTQSGFPVM